MATMFRAVVMLVVLVGLPSAWVYYGPLPPAAMGVIERTVASARQSFGWEEQVTATRWTVEAPKTAPRYDASMTQVGTQVGTQAGTQAGTQVVANQAAVQAAQTLQQQAAVEQTALPLRPVMRDAQFSLSSATVPTPKPAAPAAVGDELARQLEPHLSLLRSLDAAEYTLENWGGENQLYRFRCAVVLGENDDHTRQFEAVHADPLRAVHAVVGEVTSWQNARRTSGGSLWR